MVEIYIGIPENDRTVNVPTDWTVSQVLSEYDVSTTGMVQHNGRTLRTDELGKTLDALGVTTGDQIYVVTKLDSA